ncbi:hypothetical protein Tco_1155436 [Tanacetum coccineum]
MISLSSSRDEHSARSQQLLLLENQPKPPSSKKPKSLPTKNILAYSFHRKVRKETLLFYLLIEDDEAHKNSIPSKEKVDESCSRNWQDDDLDRIKKK